MKNGKLKFEDIHERIKLIDGSNTDYISENGNVYKKNLNTGLYLKKKTHVVKSCGYVYCGITKADGKNHSMRVHKLVANAFIPKIDGKNIVGHQDNDKTNNVYTNLYWTTVSENTKKAFNDGLEINDKGFDDSQSMSVDVYDLKGNFIITYGSQREASEALKISNSTIGRQCIKQRDGIKYTPRCGYIFKFHEEN